MMLQMDFNWHFEIFSKFNLFKGGLYFAQTSLKCLANFRPDLMKDWVDCIFEV